MQHLAVSVFVASAVFLVLMTGIDALFSGAALNGETLMSNAFKTLIFAMAFAAIRVGAILFKKDNQE